jgi:mercuric ion transport protein
MRTNDKVLWLTVGTLIAAVTASLCCILPVVVVVLGVGSAALGATFEPLRPYFTVVTLGLLAFGFYQAYRPRPECAPGESCGIPENRSRQRLALWIIAPVAVLLLAFPHYVGWLI